MKNSETPAISRLNRRDFLVLAGTTIAGAITSPRTGQARSDESAVTLSHLPSTSPGFQVRPLPDQGLLVWSRSPSGELTAYRLNSIGRQVWELCSGHRGRAEIGDEYQRLTGRGESEGIDFVDRLLALGVIVSGGEVVASGSFPVPGPGGAYHHSLRNQPSNEG